MQRIVLNTGDGKGKTTASLGMVLRAVGHGQKVLFAQFIKTDTSVGEVNALKSLEGVTFLQDGLGFVNPENAQTFEDHSSVARGFLRQLINYADLNTYDMIVLDEVNTACGLGLFTIGDVLHLISRMVDVPVIVLTGRDAPPELVDLADTVTEMRCVKHAYFQGVSAQKGVEC